MGAENKEQKTENGFISRGKERFGSLFGAEKADVDTGIKVELVAEKTGIAADQLKMEISGNKNEDEELMDSNYEEFSRDIKSGDAIPFEKIRSHGREVNPQTGMTLCSTTVQKDAQTIFNIELSGGHGSAQGEIDNYDYKGRTPSCELKGANLQGSYEQIEAQMKGDVFDIFTHSNQNPQYNHRFLGFRLRTGGEAKYRALDPYIKGLGSNNPIPLEDYYNKVCVGMRRPLLKIVGFDTKREVFASQDIANDTTQEAKEEAKAT